MIISWNWTRCGTNDLARQVWGLAHGIPADVLLPTMSMRWCTRSMRYSVARTRVRWKSKCHNLSQSLQLKMFLASSIHHCILRKVMWIWIVYVFYWCWFMCLFHFDQMLPQSLVFRKNQTLLLCGLWFSAVRHKDVGLLPTDQNSPWIKMCELGTPPALKASELSSLFCSCTPQLSLSSSAELQTLLMQ